MASISTRKGDAGTTGLGGGSRTSKGDLRVECLRLDRRAQYLHRCRARRLRRRANIRPRPFDSTRAVRGWFGGFHQTRRTQRDSEIGPEMVALLDAAVEQMEAEPNICAIGRSRANIAPPRPRRAAGTGSSLDVPSATPCGW